MVGSSGASLLRAALVTANPRKRPSRIKSAEVERGPSVEGVSDLGAAEGSPEAGRRAFPPPAACRTFPYVLRCGLAAAAASPAGLLWRVCPRLASPHATGPCLALLRLPLRLDWPARA